MEADSQGLPPANFVIILLSANSLPRLNAGWWESSDQPDHWLPPPLYRQPHSSQTFKTPRLPSFGETRWNETNLRPRFCLPADITRNKNAFLAISLVFRFLFGPSCVTGREPMFVGSNTTSDQLKLNLWEVVPASVVYERFSVNFDGERGLRTAHGCYNV